MILSVIQKGLNTICKHQVITWRMSLNSKPINHDKITSKISFKSCLEHLVDFLDQRIIHAALE